MVAGPLLKNPGARSPERAGATRVLAGERSSIDTGTARPLAHHPASLRVRRPDCFGFSAPDLRASPDAPRPARRDDSLMSDDQVMCRLQAAVSHVERCPRDAACPFWRDGECLIAGLDADLEGNPALAQMLLRLRSQMISPEPAWRPFGMVASPAKTRRQGGT